MKPRTTHLQQQLSQLLNRTKSAVPLHGITSSRTDITSEELCDDTIKYLAPTLEKHKGCTLIDIHPGPCVWSKKLHDFLKPKYHLLIEPEPAYYDKFIKPLLDEPGSTYRHSAFPDQSPSAMVSDWHGLDVLKTLEAQRNGGALAADDSRKNVLDPNLLITGNAVRRYRTRVGVNAVALASPTFMLSHLAAATLGHSAWQNLGLGRMLWWLHEDVKKAVFPLKVTRRTAMTAVTGLAFDVAEVVGVTPYPNYMSETKERLLLQRFSALDEKTDELVKQRSQAAGMKVPPDRGVLEGAARADMDPNIHKSPYANLKDNVAEMERAVDRCHARLRAIRRHRYARLKQPLIDDVIRRVGELEYPHVRDAAMQLGGDNADPFRAKVALLADVGLRAINLEASFKTFQDREPSNPHLPALSERISGVEDARRAAMTNMSPTLKRWTEEIIEEEIVFHISNGLNLRDTRPFEPLRAHKTDFFPHKTMMLLDMVPKGTDLSVPDLARQVDGWRFCYALAHGLFNISGYSVIDALNQLAINAGQDLVPMAPSLTNPLKGGRLNPKHLRACMLTNEMLAELVHAFFEWPFRPENWEAAFNLVSVDSTMYLRNRQAEAEAEVEAEAETNGEGEDEEKRREDDV